MVVLSSPLALIQSVPPVTRAFTAFTVISSATYGYLWWKNLQLEAVLYLTLVPGGAIYAPWTFLTSAFVETTVFEVGDGSFRILVNPTNIYFLSVRCITDFRTSRS